MSDSIKFSIVIPAKNEAKDIHLAVESALAQTYANKEVIVVDDSEDDTREVVGKYPGVALIEGKQNGCCQARNLGIQKASGDVIVFLNADTKLAPDHLSRMAEHYAKGYHWVTTGDYSFNQDNIYSRFIQSLYLVEEVKRKNFDPLTSSGFSVRRDAALAVGMISGKDYPFNFCRDWTLGNKLRAEGYKKFHDQSLMVAHKSPDNFKEFWQVRKTRGLMSAYQPYFMFKRSLPYLFIKFGVKSGLDFLRFAAVIPAAIKAFELARASDRGLRDCFPMYYAYLVHILARNVGEWQGLLNIRKISTHETS